MASYDERFPASLMFFEHQKSNLHHNRGIMPERVAGTNFAVVASLWRHCPI